MTSSSHGRHKQLQQEDTPSCLFGNALGDDGVLDPFFRPLHHTVARVRGPVEAHHGPTISACTRDGAVLGRLVSEHKTAEYVGTKGDRCEDPTTSLLNRHH